MPNLPSRFVDVVVSLRDGVTTVVLENLLQELKRHWWLYSRLDIVQQLSYNAMRHLSVTDGRLRGLAR